MFGWAAVAVVEVADRPRVLLCVWLSRLVSTCSLGASSAEGRLTCAASGPCEAKSLTVKPGGEAITPMWCECECCGLQCNAGQLVLEDYSDRRAQNVRAEISMGSGAMSTTILSRKMVSSDLRSTSIVGVYSTGP